MVSNTQRAAKPLADPAPKHEDRPAIVPDPPRPHRWFLILTIVALAAWMAFLAYMALRPS
jgi:hypothetical protein